MSRTPGIGCFAREPGPARNGHALGPVLTNGAPLAIDPAQRFVSPRTEHLFGTDHLGRDVFALVLYGGRTSLFVGAFVTPSNKPGGVADYTEQKIKV